MGARAECGERAVRAEEALLGDGGRGGRRRRGARRLEPRAQLQRDALTPRLASNVAARASAAASAPLPRQQREFAHSGEAIRATSPGDLAARR